MKNLTHSLRFALSALVLTVAMQAGAYDFYTGGLYYQIASSGTVVTVENNGSFNTYSGNVTIPSSVTYNGKTYNVTGIGYQAFKNCTNLTSVTLPNTLTMMLNEAFYGCTKLTSITLPSSLTSIYNNVFVGCTGLTSIYVKRTTPVSASTNNFSSSTYSSATLYVPSGTLSAYQSTAPWSSFTHIVESTYDFVYNGIYYLKTGTNTVSVAPKDKSYNSYSGYVSIPSSVTYEGTTYSVTAIGDNAMKNSTGLTGLSIPSSVTTLGSWAVSGCTALTSITIPNSVTSVGASVFMDCAALKTVSIGSGLKKVGNFMFIRCKALQTITIPNTVTEIGYETFEDCIKLYSIDIGSGVTSIGHHTFKNCTTLVSITCHALTPPTVESSTFDSNNYTSATLYVPKSAESAYKAANYWKNFTTIRTIYDFKVNGLYYNKTSSNTVEVTYKDSNFNSYSGGITIPKTITVNGTTYKVTAIGSQAFRNCDNLSDVTLCTNIETIEGFAFAYSTKLSSIYSMPSALKRIKNDAFYGCTSLSYISLPNNLEQIDTYAFRGCTALTSIALPNGLTTLGNNVFEGCTGLKNVTIGTGLVNIPGGVFKGCTGLTSMTFPDNVQSIYGGSFENCTSLAEITLGSGMTSLAQAPFKGCTALKTVTSLAVTPPYMSASDCFTSTTYSTGTLKVPGASLDAYKSADWWRMFNTISEMPFDFCVNGIYYKKTSNNTVEVTCKEYFYETYKGTVTIPSSIKVGGKTYNVTAIGDYAFYMCKNLTKVNMPTSITVIGGCAFEKCTGLTSVVIPNSVVTLSIDAFCGCTGLTSVEIPSSVTTIGYLAFGNCTGLTSVVIGSGVKTIESVAFKGCTALNSITCMPNTPPTMKSKECFDTNTYNTAKLYVPERSLNAYRSTDWWRLFSSIIGGDFGGDPCDVNGDGEVNIADVNAIIDAILKGNNDLKYDANCDGEVNIADVNAVIAAILKG